MSRRTQKIPMFVALVALVALVAGCSVGKQLEDQLEGEPCTVEKDCWSTQDCTRTVDEESLDLAGTCQPEGTGCVIGRQLGCDCDPLDPSLNCSSSVYPAALQATYPTMICDPKINICVVAPPQGGV